MGTTINTQIQTKKRSKPWKKWIIRITITLVLLILTLMIGFVIFANYYVNDESIPVSTQLLPKDAPKIVLAIFAHPDDEIMISGTYHKLSEDPEMITILATLTKGEAGGTGGLVSQEELGDTREKELRNAGEILAVDYQEIFEYPDSGLTTTDPNKIKETIRALISKYKPTTILTYDDNVGLYGHPDHVVTGKLVKEVIAEELQKETSVQRLYMATLPEPMIKTALKLSSTFKERYPREPGKGLPEPTIAFPMASESKIKKKILLTHKTQWESIASVQPFHDKIPSWIYYRIFDREYYHLVDFNK